MTTIIYEKQITLSDDNTATISVVQAEDGNFSTVVEFSKPKADNTDAWLAGLHKEFSQYNTADFGIAGMFTVSGDHGTAIYGYISGTSREGVNKTGNNHQATAQAHAEKSTKRSPIPPSPSIGQQIRNYDGGSGSTPMGGPGG